MHATLTTALALSLLLSPAGAQDPASLLPADTMLYTGTDSLRKGSLAARNSAMRLILNEPEVKAFLNKPLTTLDRVFSEASKQSGLDVPAISMTDIVLGSEEGPPVGRLFTALTHFNMEAGDGGQPSLDIGLVMGVEMLSRDDLGMIQGLWNMIPAAQEETGYEGHTLFIKHGPSGNLSAHLAFLDNLAVLSLSRDTIEGVIDRYSSGGNSLASTTEYARLLELGGGEHAGGSTTFMRPGSFMTLARQGMAMALAQGGEQAMTPKVMAILDGVGMEALQALGSTSYRDAKGLVHSTQVTFRDLGGQGFLADMMETKPIDMDNLAGLPGNAMGAAGLSVPNLAVIYDFIMGIIDQIEPAASAKVRSEIERIMPESDLRRMVLENVGGEMWSFTLPNQGIMQMPASVYRVEAKDPELFVQAIEKMIAFASSESGMSINLKADESDGVKAWSLDLSKTPAAMMLPGMTPGFGIDGGDLLFSMESVDLLRSSVNGKAGEGSLLSIPEFASFVSGLQSSGEVVNFTFSDNEQAFKAIYGQFAGMAQMFGGGMKDLPIDLALLPTEGSVSQHLRYSMSGGYQSGNEVVGQSISQFEMSDFMPFIVMGAAFFGLAESNAFGDVMAMEDAADPSKQVMDDLGRIKAGLTIYKIMDADRAYPDTLDAIIQPLPDYPNGYMGELELPLDPWGNGYHYALDGRKVKLWSGGPDGIDEQGDGDDIVKTK